MEDMEHWRRKVVELYGYKLMCLKNLEEVASALAKISDLLDDQRDPQITVREQVVEVVEIEAIMRRHIYPGLKVFGIAEAALEIHQHLEITRPQ